MVDDDDDDDADNDDAFLQLRQEHIRFHHGVYLYMVTWQEKKNTAKPKEAELQTTSKSNLEYLFNLYDPKTILSLWRQYLITVYRDFSTVQDGPGSSNVNTDSYTVRANEFHPLMLPQCTKPPSGNITTRSIMTGRDKRPRNFVTTSAFGSKTFLNQAWKGASKRLGSLDASYGSCCSCLGGELKPYGTVL
eukprot:scaffold901_cov167-Amphora_coffeaeformis.AAC.1